MNSSKSSSKASSKISPKSFLKKFFILFIVIQFTAILMVTLISHQLSSGLLIFVSFLIFALFSAMAFFWMRKNIAPLEELHQSISTLEANLKTQEDRLSLERQEHATLMSTVFDAVVAVDSDGYPLFYNSKFALLLGKGQPIHGRHIGKIFLDQQCVDAFETAFKTSEPQTVAAFAMDTETGRAYFSLTVSLLKRENGETYGAVGIFHDVTELKKAEQIRIQFVANVSHELRTPLTSIKGFTDTLLQDAKSNLPLSASHLEKISRNTDRLMSLIQDLLDLSSLESSDQVQKSWISTQEISNQIITQFEPVLRDKKQTITLNCGTQKVLADPQRVEQVLMNLLSNANKYAPNGTAISVDWSKDAKGFTVLSVHDNGPGIPSIHHDRLFERFYRIDKSRSRDQGGTGLGLAIVKHIMQSHDGSVSLQSKPGSGTTFYCRFPA